jgi:S1-C subfamily serine protease
MKKQIFFLGITFSFVLGIFLFTQDLLAAAVTQKTPPLKHSPSLEQRVISLEKDMSHLKKQISDLTKMLKQTRAEYKAGTGKTQDELLTAAVSKTSPSVVSVVISKDIPQLEVVYRNPFGDDPFFKDFNIRVPTYKQKGTKKEKVGAGTGFIITSDGYIATNKHVVEDEKAEYMVLLSDGNQKKAKVYYRDPLHDVAIIKIEGNAYKAIPLGNSNTIKLGQTVIAIGNALGEYNNSVSVGIISGIDRSIQASNTAGKSEQLTHVIQTDAAINPGNSGGPLIDIDGNVIGVNVATVLGSQSIGFSIPVNNIRDSAGLALGRKL